MHKQVDELAHVKLVNSYIKYLEEKFLWLIIILLNLYKVVFHKKVLVISYKKNQINRSKCEKTTCYKTVLRGRITICCLSFTYTWRLFGSTHDLHFWYCLQKINMLQLNQIYRWLKSIMSYNKNKKEIVKRLIKECMQKSTTSTIMLPAKLDHRLSFIVYYYDWTTWWY